MTNTIEEKMPGIYHAAGTGNNCQTPKALSKMQQKTSEGQTSMKPIAQHPQAKAINASQLRTPTFRRMRLPGSCLVAGVNGEQVKEEIR